MRADELLLWLSARREGSWRQFRAAVEELHSDSGEADIDEDEDFPLHQQLRVNFEVLAHVEFFAHGCEQGWRVAPPTFAVHPFSSGVRAVLCGARSPALRERLLCAAAQPICGTLHIPGAPEVIRINCSGKEALAQVAEQIGVHIQDDAPLAILSHLLPCDPPLRGTEQAEFPVGRDWNIQEFNATDMCWHQTERRHVQKCRTGAFRFLHRYQSPTYFLRWAGSTYKLPRAVALYALLRRSCHKLLRYDARTQTLRMPAICRPPRLLERALVLCSGVPACYEEETASLAYGDIPREIARFAAELLRQALNE